MDLSYQPTRSGNNYLKFVPIIIVVTIIGGVLFLFLRKPKIVSPLPETPSFEVIFYTPSPEPITPTSSPSATPKVKKTAATVAPTKAATQSANITTTVKPTAKPTATSTIKPTATLTPNP